VDGLELEGQLSRLFVVSREQDRRPFNQHPGHRAGVRGVGRMHDTIDVDVDEEAFVPTQQSATHDGLGEHEAGRFR